jgi:serine protease Do
MKRNIVAWAALIVSSAALVNSSGVMRPVPAAPQIDEESQKVAKALSESFERVANFVKPSVVSIETRRRITSNGNPFQRTPRNPNGAVPKNVDPEELQEMLKRFFDPNGGPQFENQQFGLAQGTGSGFVFDGNGHIVTNNHVVEDAEKITVTFHDGEEVTAKVVGTDPKSDIAVIKVEMSGYRPALLGKSEALKVGEWVLAVGSPFGFDQSVTAGIVSALGRGEAGIIGRDSYEDFIQTDASINPGNSGGPLVDLSGRVVGINSAIATSTRSNAGVGFAIPISMAQNIAERLIKDGKVNRGAIGIALQPLSPALAKQFGLDSKTKGVLVNSVLPDSPAQKAGLQSGDIIVGFDDHEVISVPSFRNLVATSEMGKSHSLTYYRDGKKMTTEITLAPAEKILARDETEVQPRERPEAKPKPEAKVELKDFGIELQELTPDFAKNFKFGDDVKGALISKVAPNSAAEAAGLVEGLVVTKVVRQGKVNAVSDPKQFAELTGKSQEITIYVQAPEGGRFVTLDRAK